LEHFDASVDAVYVKEDVTDIVLEDFDVPFLKRKDPEAEAREKAKEDQDAIVSACDVCLAGKVPCEPLVLTGDPAEEIINKTKSGNYDLLVMGSHGRSALKGFVLGTLHSKILHHIDRPVLIAREIREIQKVLVAYRGTRCDQAALRFLGPLLERKKPEITVLHVQETELEESDEFAKTCLIQSDQILQGVGHAPATKSAAGDFVDETVKEITLGGYDLIVLGAYGHEKSGLMRFISDEAINLVSRTTRPVLVYRDQAQSP
jgi:nucleotide-binding universal stress UspA family protein